MDLELTLLLLAKVEVAPLDVRLVEHVLAYRAFAVAVLDLVVKALVAEHVHAGGNDGVLLSVFAQRALQPLVEVQHQLPHPLGVGPAATLARRSREPLAPARSTKRG